MKKYKSNDERKEQKNEWKERSTIATAKSPKAQIKQMKPAKGNAE